MSRAFLSEEDCSPEADVPEIRIPLPAGARNYVTPRGGRKLQEELSGLERRERPRLTAAVSRLVREAGDHEALSRSRRRLREVLRRIEYLNQMIARMEIVEAEGSTGEHRVRFGLPVTVRGPGEQTRVFRIVGVDESDPAAGSISWISPLARALTGACVGDRVEVDLPEGRSGFQILAVGEAEAGGNAVGEDAVDAGA